MNLQALIFDVDGTLADTEEAHRCAFNVAFARFGLGWTWSRDTYRDLLAITGGKERIAAFLATLPIDSAESKRLAEMIPAIHAEKTTVYGRFIADGALPLRDGVAHLADEALAAGCRLAIASTTSAANIDALLLSAFGARGPAMFSVVACGDQVRAKKPAPDIYRLALARLGTEPAMAVAFEDSHIGLRAAAAAGLWTVVTPTCWTASQDFSGAGLLLPSLGKLSLDALARRVQPEPA